MAKSLANKVLGKDYVKVIIESVNVKDHLSDSCEVTLTLNNKIELVKEGVGTIDAIFSCLKSYYAKEYPSLESINLTQFKVVMKGSGTEAICSVSIILENSRKDQFEFTNESRSLTASSARAVGLAVEFFVNSEKAFITLHRALEDAKSRNRYDLVTRYTKELAEIVKSTSYTNTIEILSKELSL